MSASKKSALELVHIAAAFEKAVGEAAFHPYWEEKLSRTQTPANLAKLKGLRDTFNRAVADLPLYRAAMASGHITPEDQAELQQQVAPLVLHALDESVAILWDGLTEEEIASFIPEEARNDETADAFEAHGAPNYAKLCRLAPR